MLLKASGKDKQNYPSIGSYSNNIDDYELVGEIGRGATAIVYIARYKPFNSTVAVKIVNLEGYENNIKEVQNEIAVMIRCSHPNVVQYYSSFLDDMELWLVMRLLDGGSVLDIMNFSERNGIEEVAMATILKEVLKALSYFHANGHIHRDVKAGNILIDTDGTVQLADFGVSSCLSLPNETRKTFAGTPCWMAPEVIEQTTGYNHKADIWSFGITAIELATGRAPYSHLPAAKVMIAVLNNPSPTLEVKGSSGYSKSFKKMIDECLRKDPTKRPTADELLKHDFFKKAKGPDYIVQSLISKLPPLSERRKSKGLSAIGRNGVSKTISEEEAGWDYDTSTLVASAPPRSGTLNLKLRTRSKSGVLNDIRFPFKLESDTPKAVAAELVEHGLVAEEDEAAVCSSLQFFIKHPHPMVFEVKKSNEAVADKKALIGFAALSIDQ
ncbi:STE20/SPS1-related proline-alanine-rich protein kinase-like isoform X2 [Zophobas morio]|uniref:STE20/SPS1-related proline-alanine-rich protein kinase-like isoform X2 n=1 Tax=Zophobas morio TaxID=2755281 RepID=UPI003083CC60